MNKFYSISPFKWILVIVIILWCILSFFRLVYNGTKLFTEEKAWIGLTEEQRKMKAYGTIEQIYQTLNTKLKNTDCALLDTNSTTSYFLLRYLLYPKRVYSLKKGYSIPLKSDISCINLSL